MGCSPPWRYGAQVSIPSEPLHGAASEYAASEYSGSNYSASNCDEPAEGRHRDAEQSFSLYGDRTGSGAADAPVRGFNSLVRRPAEMWAGAVFLTLAALPLALLGGGLALLPGQYGTNLRQRIGSAGTSVSADTLILLFRVCGAVLLVLSVACIVLAWRAVRPNRKARLGVSVLAVLAVLGLAFTMVVTVADPVSFGVALLAAAGTLLLFLPRSEEFMRAQR
jgi:hypothetical protein